MKLVRSLLYAYEIAVVNSHSLLLISHRERSFCRVSHLSATLYSMFNPFYGYLYTTCTNLYIMSRTCLLMIHIRVFCYLTHSQEFESFHVIQTDSNSSGERSSLYHHISLLRCLSVCCWTEHSPCEGVLRRQRGGLTGIDVLFSSKASCLGFARGSLALESSPVNLPISKAAPVPRRWKGNSPLARAS
jgi:hypothetical protein